MKTDRLREENQNSANITKDATGVVFITDTSGAISSRNLVYLAAPTAANIPSRAANPKPPKILHAEKPDAPPERWIRQKSEKTHTYSNRRYQKYLLSKTHASDLPDHQPKENRPYFHRTFTHHDSRNHLPAVRRLLLWDSVHKVLPDIHPVYPAFHRL